MEKMEKVSTYRLPFANNIKFEDLDMTINKSDTIRDLNKKVDDCIGRIKNDQNELTEEQLGVVVSNIKNILDMSLIKLANATQEGVTKYQGEKIDVLKLSVWHRIEYPFERFDFKRILMNE